MRERSKSVMSRRPSPSAPAASVEGQESRTDHPLSQASFTKFVDWFALLPQDTPPRQLLTDSLFAR